MLLIYLVINMPVDLLFEMNVVWARLLGRVDRSSAPALRGCRGDSRPALFKNLNYFNIWRLKIERDQRVSLLATIIVLILAYERADDRCTLMHTENTNWAWKHSGFGVQKFTWDKGEKKRQEGPTTKWSQWYAL